MTDARSPMFYAEFEPDPELKPWIAAYWHFSVEPDSGVIDHWIPLTGAVMLAFPRGGAATVTGPRIEPLVTQVRGGQFLWGVHFWPGAAASLLGLDPKLQQLRDVLGLAREVVDERWVARLENRLRRTDDQVSAARSLNGSLLELKSAAGPLDDIVMTAVFRLIAAGGDQSLDDLVESLGLSARHFRRRFRAAAELSPKEFARLQRMRSAAIDAVRTREGAWVDVAAERGYADQAHLVREFRRILGLTPSAFGEHASRIRHGRILR